MESERNQLFVRLCEREGRAERGLWLLLAKGSTVRSACNADLVVLLDE